MIAAGGYSHAASPVTPGRSPLGRTELRPVLLFALRQQCAGVGGTVAALEGPSWEGFMGRTARERLAKLLDDAQASGGFSAQILAPADALRVEVDGVGVVHPPVR